MDGGVFVPDLGACLLKNIFYRAGGDGFCLGNKSE